MELFARTSNLGTVLTKRRLRLYGTVLLSASAGFRSRKDAWADTTTTPHGRLMLTVLGGLPAFERVLQ